MRFRWPRCKCCMRLCPCFYCCHPEILMDREAVINQMAKTSPKGRQGVNMQLVEDQLRNDRQRLLKNKQKWRRRWLVCCCCSFIIIVATATVVILVLATSAWTLVNENCDWAARMHFGAVFITSQRRLIVLGGTDNVQNFADVWGSTDSGESWHIMAESPGFSPRHGHALICDQSTGGLFVLGGDASIGQEVASPLNDVWSSTDGREWVRQVASAAWIPRKHFGATVDADGNLYIVGGLTGIHGGGLNDMWRSMDQGRTWHPVSLTSPWSARSQFAFARLPGGTRSGRLLILGGTDGRAQHDVWSSDDHGSTWQLMSFSHVREQMYRKTEERASWNPRFGASAVGDFDGTITLTGGGDEVNAFSKEVWQLESPPSDSIPWYLRKTNDDRLNRARYPEQWSLEATPIWDPRRNHQSFVDDEDVIFILGGEAPTGLKNDIWKMERSIKLQNLIDAYESTATSFSSDDADNTLEEVDDVGGGNGTSV